MKSTYRPDIDGLRFFAVTPVVLFHAGLSEFRGGFVGVDIFFVISGYLITRIIFDELEQNEFSLLNFYERRIRRIFPALFAMIAFVCLFAPGALLPSELRKLPYEVFGALTFLANFVFWRQSDYFASAAEEKPLLHTWSLGLEEQFYIFAPLGLWVIFRYARWALFPILLGVLAFSFTLSVWLTPLKNSAAFYLLPTRAWELLAGSILAIGIPQLRSTLINEGASAIGLACILVSIFTFNEHTSFPGYAAALPVLGAVLIIQFAEKTAVGRLLSSRPLVFIGLISYSLYLWHWPLIVFFRDWGLLESVLGQSAVIALSFTMAWASWKFIETPFRVSSKWTRSRLFWFSGTATSVLAATATVLYLTNGWPNRFTSENLFFDQKGRHDISPYREQCHIKSGHPPFDTLCRLGVGDGVEPSTIVWGDSHGVELAAALSEAGLPLIQATYSACPPALKFSPRSQPSCGTHNDLMLQAITADEQIKTVVLTAFYIRHSNPNFWSGMEDTAASLKEAGKQVIVIGAAPEFNHKNIPSHLTAGHRSPLKHTKIPTEFSQYFSDTPNISLIDKLCHNGMCPLTVDGKPILFDANHLSITAARSIATDIVREILNIQANAATH